MYICMYVRMYVCMYVCMYILHVCKIYIVGDIALKFATLERPAQILLIATKVVLETSLLFLLFHHGVSPHSHIHYCDANKCIG